RASRKAPPPHVARAPCRAPRDPTANPAAVASPRGRLEVRQRTLTDLHQTMLGLLTAPGACLPSDGIACFACPSRSHARLLLERSSPGRSDQDRFYLLVRVVS